MSNSFIIKSEDKKKPKSLFKDLGFVSGMVFNSNQLLKDLKEIGDF